MYNDFCIDQEKAARSYASWAHASHALSCVRSDKNLLEPEIADIATDQSVLSRFDFCFDSRIVAMTARSTDLAPSHSTGRLVWVLGWNSGDVVSMQIIEADACDIICPTTISK